MGRGLKQLDFPRIYNALMWTGTAESVVNLHPAGFDISFANAASGDYQVGFGGGAGNFGSPALMWNGTAESVVNLNPTGYGASEAKDISGNSQVGWGEKDFGPRALLWHGTAESVVDLHPATGYKFTDAHFVAGDSQLGVGFTTEGPAHVLLWHGTAESMVDLHPAGFDESIPFVGSGLDESGDYQIGVGLLGEPGEFASHALLWQGTAESVVDLHSYLEGDFTDSLPLVVFPDGSVMGSATEQVGESEFRSHAVLWTPVPEPTGLALACCAIIGAAALRCKPRQSR